MGRVLVLLAGGFEEVEAVTVVDVLRRAELEVITAGLEGREAVEGSHGVAIVPDIAFSQRKGEWDLVVLPGGMEGAEALAKSDSVLEFIRDRAARGRLVAAICAAPLVLDRAGVLRDGEFTCYPGVESQMQATGRRHEKLVDERGIITSQSPATAMEFALYLVGRLAGASRSKDVARAMLVV